MNQVVQTNQKEAAPQNTKASALARMASKYNISQTMLKSTLKETAFRGTKDKSGNYTPVTDEQFVALVVVADQYGLNPFTKEIYAFPDPKSGGIVPVVSVDGWIKLGNNQPTMDGIELEESEERWNNTVLPEKITCKIYRKDRSLPIVISEYMGECKRGTGPWDSHPRRMLRHKALIQGFRVAFGLVGIYDQDEAENILEAGNSGTSITVHDEDLREINQQIEHATAEKKKAHVKESTAAKTDEPASIEEHFDAPALPNDPSISYSECRAMIEQAETLDLLGDAADLIEMVSGSNAEQKVEFERELSDLIIAKRAELNKKGKK